MDDSPPLPPAEALVTELYRGLLGREPDPAGLRAHAAAMRAGRSLAEMARLFVDSGEFAAAFTGKHKTPALGPRIDLHPGLAIELALTPPELGVLWAHVARVWAGLGEHDPYWSVLSVPQFRLAQMTDSSLVDQFYDSGERDLVRLEAWLRRNGLALAPETVVAEYGCGVGRLTWWLARRCARVRAFDISPTHLAHARNWLGASGIGNVAFALVRQPDDLDSLAGSDLFISLLVLQHNPPPIMALILQRAFAHLRPGGVAFFQVPTYMANYSFAHAAYVEAIGGREDRIEMHCLPQREIFRLAAAAGMAVLEVEEDGAASGVATSHTFLMRKKEGQGSALDPLRAEPLEPQLF